MTAPYVLSETELVEVLLRPGWCDAVLAGEGDRARREVRAHLERWCANGMGYQIVNGERRFDPVDINFVTERGLTGEDPFLRERVIPAWRAYAERHAPRQPPSERFHDPRRMSFTHRRELPIAKPPGSRVIVSMAIPTEGPGQRELVVQPFCDGGTARVEDGLLVARTTVGEDGYVRFGATMTCVAYQHSVTIDSGHASTVSSSSELAPYLARSEGLIKITPTIEQVARRLARPDPWATVLAIWEHLFETKKLGAIYHHELDADDPLGASPTWIDCYVGSAYLVACARAAGIPARLVRGLIAYPPVSVANHYWSEIHLEPHGWIPLDLLGWIFAAGDAHDRRWGRHLVGHLPYQLVVHRLPSPLLELGVVYPRRWYSVGVMAGTGLQDTTYDFDSGAVVKRDTYDATIASTIEAADAVGR